MSEDIHQFMCGTEVVDLHKVINNGLASVGQKLNPITNASQEDWAMAMTVNQNSKYFDHGMKTVATRYVKDRNGEPSSAYMNFGPDSKHGKEFTANLEKIKEWSEGKGPCAFQNAKPHADVYAP